MEKKINVCPVCGSGLSHMNPTWKRNHIDLCRKTLPPVNWEKAGLELIESLKGLCVAIDESPYRSYFLTALNRAKKRIVKHEGA